MTNKIYNYVIRYESTAILQIKLMQSLNPFGNLTDKNHAKLTQSLNTDNHKFKMFNIDINVKSANQ